MVEMAGVVVLYNPDEQVWKNINIYHTSIERLYIIDNSEKDIETHRQKSNQYPNAMYLSFGKNMGLASALNKGATMAILDGYKWLLTMDQDSVFSSNIVSIYERYILSNDTSKIAILSPQYETERHQAEDINGTTILKWTMQSAALFNLEIYKKIGSFKEKYFIDCIDYEYCLRAAKQGFQTVRCNDAILIHSPAINRSVQVFGKTLNYGYASPVRIYYQVRNSLDMWRIYREKRAIGIVVVKLGKIILLFDNKKEFIKYFNRGIRDSYRNRFGSYGELY